MYRLKHFIFGWDYIHWDNGCDQGIARVYKTKEGKIYYWRYRIIDVLDVIHRPDQVIWLTCKSDKYFKQEEK